MPERLQCHVDDSISVRFEGFAQRRLRAAQRVTQDVNRCDQSTPNASSTLPGRRPKVPYPELMKSIPPATTGAGPFIDPPLALTPLTVLKAWLVSKVQTTDPSLAA